ncbi:MAG: sulfatase-like hydrolase/transferase [Candidatus Omnitrophica bacterium]|nr:sulfatase-like hydrolase/transferase [Candidatus Omnitrophota bacterium]
MDRRKCLQALSIFGSSSFLSQYGWGKTNSPQKRRPNIIIILADDMGYGDLSCYGGETIQTPHLDALAAGGARFSDFHSSGPVCSPTRAGLLTGRYQQRCGIPEVLTVAGRRDQGLSPEEVTFSKLFQEAGYKTACFGKWHLGYRPEFNPIHHGFGQFRGYLSGNVDYISHIDQAGVYDWWDGAAQIHEEGYVTRLITKHALRFIEENQDNPFLLYLPHEAPHYPYQGPNDNADRTVGGKFDNHGSRQDVKGAYKIMIEELDDSVGEVMEKIRRLHLERDTFVFFFSDNGATQAGSNGPLRGFKGSLWEGGHRVPAFAYWPGIVPPARIIRDPAISLDIFPTLLSAAEIKRPAGFNPDGIDLLPFLCFTEKIPNRTLYWWYKRQKAVRQGDWKLLVQENGNAETVRLFNLQHDLAEKNDVSSQHPDLMKTLLNSLNRWLEDVKQ